MDGLGRVEEVGGDRRARQLSRRAPCCEWLKTRSERRMRSKEGTEERGSKRGAVGPPQVKPCDDVSEIGRGGEETNDGVRRCDPWGIAQSADVERDVLGDVVHERRVGEVGDDDLRVRWVSEEEEGGRGDAPGLRLRALRLVLEAHLLHQARAHSSLSLSRSLRAEGRENAVLGSATWRSQRGTGCGL